MLSFTNDELATLTSDLQTLLSQLYLPSTTTVHPTNSTLKTSSSALLTALPPTGLGFQSILHSLTTDVIPGLSASSISSHYYGFVTGGATPAALAGDIMTVILDQNVQMHLPLESLSTTLETRAFEMLLELFHLPKDDWKGRAFTTGATGSNILGLACGREAILEKRLAGTSVGELGILQACMKAGVTGVQVLSAMTHSSVTKAASILGIGRKNVVDVGRGDMPWEFDMEELERRLKDSSESGVVSIMVVGYGEVNTGRFSTGLKKMRKLADQYGGWIHIDAAFGIFARVLQDSDDADMKAVASWAEELECADSIAGDGHKLLNVPYDCGFFFTRTPELQSSVLINAAPYLTPAPNAAIPSPLNTHIENSRRFRALPVYATLAAYGRNGYEDMVKRMIGHTRAVASVISRHDAYELLPDGDVQSIFMVTLFRAKDEGLNKVLKDRINRTNKVYVSGTVWNGKPAVRCAVGNWRVSEKKEGSFGWGVMEEVLETVAAEWTTIAALQ